MSKSVAVLMGGVAGYLLWREDRRPDREVVERLIAEVSGKEP